jgi:hypothetical protein
MRYTIYEHPITRKFGFLPLPPRYVDGDVLPADSVDRWFESYADAVASLPDLLDEAVSPEEPASDGGVPADTIRQSRALSGSSRWC